MCDLRDDSVVDVVTLTALLRDRGELDRVGGYTYVASLSAACPAVSGLPAYVSRVREQARLRELLLRCAEIRESVLSGESLEVSLDRAESLVLGVRGSQPGSLTSAKRIVGDVYETLRERSENPQAVTGVRTGFVELDRILSGMQPTDLLILAARPSMGKTAFALNVMAHAAIHRGVTTAVFSLEMSKEQLVSRLLASEARVSGSRIRTGQLREDDWSHLTKAVESVSNAPIFIDDAAAQTVGQIRAKCRRIRGLGLVVVDYLQLMRGGGSERNREQEIASISRGLKALAKEMNIPVIALSQLNRDVEKRADKRPVMADLRESGAIEQDADVIMFLYREEVYSPNIENRGVAEVLVRKHRNGATGDVKMLWRAEQVRFDNLAKFS